MQKEFIYGYTGVKKDMSVDIVKDDRDEGVGFYVDFRRAEETEPEGCLFYSDNLTNCVIFAKGVVCHYDSIEDLIREYSDQEIER